MPTKNATLNPVGGSPITARMKFVQTGNKMVITGTAKNIPSPTTVYVSLVYGVNSAHTGTTPCRDDGTLGGVILDPADILAVTAILKGVPLVGQPLAQQISTLLAAGLGPMSPANMPPPGGLMFSPKATARMFLGVWGLANPQGESTFSATRIWTGPNDPMAIPFEKIRTVSIRQPQFPLLPNPVSDVRPQIFQLRACGLIA